MTDLTQELQQIVDLGKAATKRPWFQWTAAGDVSSEPLDGMIFQSLLTTENEDGYCRATEQGNADCAYVIAAANSADILAQRLLDIGKLPDDATMKDVRKILEAR